MDFNPGDVGYVKRSNGHYIKNVGDTDLQFLEVFKSTYFADVSLSEWLTHTPPALVAQHLNVNEVLLPNFQTTSQKLCLNKTSRTSWSSWTSWSSRKPARLRCHW
jgi:oxalate decarboxylase/phosphoglucose isomerase-like protein (cupin superfamily)